MVCTSGETGASAAGSNDSDAEDEDEADAACGAAEAADGDAAKLDIRCCCCAAADDASSGEKMGEPMSMVPRAADLDCGVRWSGDCSGRRCSAYRDTIGRSSPLSTPLSSAVDDDE